MVTGSYASSIHGVARATQDIDIVIQTTRDQLLALLNGFPESEFYVAQSMALLALERKTLFNVIHLESGWKVDFILCKDRTFSHTELQRRISIEPFGFPLNVASPEDALISKLEWAKLSQSSRQIEDAAGILRIQGDRLDAAYLDYWIAELGLAQEYLCAKATGDEG